MSNAVTRGHSMARSSRLRDISQVGLPIGALIIMLAIIFLIRPAAFSYFGFTLLFKLATPLVFASLSQMLIIMLGDIDLSNGSFVGLINCVTALYLQPSRIAVLSAAVDHLVISRSSYGPVLRGAGANPRAIERAGWSLMGIRLAVYAAAGLLACLAGLTLTGLTTSGDPNIAPAYTLLGVGAAILGGGSFTGGLVSPIGTVAGALTLSLAGSLLSFLQIPSTWQIGSQGVILFLVLAGRVLVSERTS
jgi:ribose/xylose/arabinose/galactoside ABC-type transport system permease subunit